MTRVLFTVILPLIAPTALYLLWSVTLGRAKPGEPETNLWNLPWIWLVLAGALCVAAILLAVIQFGGGGEGTYVPPHLSHGTVVPGHIAPER